MNDDALKIAQLAAIIVARFGPYADDNFIEKSVQVAKQLYQLSEKAVATK